MTAQAVQAARPVLRLGARVIATYTLGRLKFGRVVDGELRRLRWVSPTVFEVTIRAHGLDYVIDSRDADSIEPA
jgi:hypothetical protein